jgi:serine/threonine protein kinase
MLNQAEFFEVAKSWCSQKNYQYIEPVGSGSFKQVFHVKDITGQSHALKIIKEPTASLRTLREVEAIQKCNHKYIAKLFDVGKHTYMGAEYDYFLEDFLSGGTLSSCVNHNGILQDELFKLVGSCLIECLAYLKTIKLVHRDIKPENVMFRSLREVPVLVDFGLVRDLEAASLTQTWVGRGPGTPYYASPEQFNNEKDLIDWRTDQFSLGVMLTKLRYGIHPYEEEGEETDPPLFLERVSRRGSQSEKFKQIVQLNSAECLSRMTNPWPVQRFRTPEELLHSWNKWNS